MKGDLSEKAHHTSPPASSHGGSTDDTAIRSQRKSGEHTGQATPNDLSLQKLDSKVIKVDAEKDDPFRHLPQAEADILKRQLFIPEVTVSYATLYRYATTNDKIIIVISIICSTAGGAALPLMTIIFGNLTGVFQGLGNGTLPMSQFSSTLASYVLYFVYLAIGEFITVYISTVGFIYTGEHISGKIREKYLAACLRQNIGFFDKLGAGEITTRITADTNLVQDGISEKVGLTLAALATFITAFVIGNTIHHVFLTLYLHFYRLHQILETNIDPYIYDRCHCSTHGHSLSVHCQI
jgi:ATP-binding cassette subfamily B (MDR/TAP) protein 1